MCQTVRVLCRFAQETKRSQQKDSTSHKLYIYRDDLIRARTSLRVAPSESETETHRAQPISCPLLW